MKCILYIGNKSKRDKKSNLSSIDVLSPLLSEEGFEIHTASDKRNIFLRLLNMLFLCYRFKNKIDFVLIDTYSTLNFYYAYFVSQWCRILKLTYIPILHGGNLPYRLKNSPKSSKAIFNHAHLNVAPSEYMKSVFNDFGYNNIVCIPNSIKIQNYPYLPRIFKKVKLLWVRSFSEIYNPLLAIKILKKLKEDGVEAKLCMVGPDSDGSLIRAKELAMDLDVQVSFTGKLSKEEWITLSKKYNIFINTTNFDNTPISVIESMALGLPIISTNVGGLTYLIDNSKEGVLVEPNSVEDFVIEIKKIMSSPEKSNLLALEARKKIENFDWNVVKKQWIKVLQ